MRTRLKFNYKYLLVIMSFLFLSVCYAAMQTSYTVSGTVYINGDIKTVTLSGSNLSFSSNTVQLAVGGETAFSVTPSTGYYLKSASCTNDYELTVETGIYQYDTQNVVVKNPSSTQNSTCTFTTERITASMLEYSNPDYTSCSDVQCAIDELYCLLGMNCATTYVYSVDSTTFNIGSTIPEGATTYNNYQDAVTAFGHPFFVRHTIRNDEITESYLGFVKDGNVYYLRGGVDESNSNKPIFEENKATLISAFGSKNCKEYTTYYRCSASGLSAYAYSGGVVGATDYSYICSCSVSVYDVGSCSCGEG